MHLHLRLLKRCRAVADRLGFQAAVMTFDLHPDTLVTGKPVPLINSRQDREDIFRRLFGMDRVVFYHFTEQTMHMPWQSFLDDYVIGELGAAHVVCGHDFHFGDRGAGNPERLTARCRELGVGCDVIDKITLDGITVSSTYIRQLIAAGLPMADASDPFTDPNSTRRTHEVTMERRAFYCQLPQHMGQNNFWEALGDWLRKTYYERYLVEGLSPEERDYRKVCIDLYCLGDVAVYANDCFRLGEHRVAAPAMDDRIACALLVSVMQALPQTRNTVIAVFSTQEEVGCRGAKTAAYSVEPDIGIALDVTANGDTPETKLPAVKLGEGAAVKIMDRGSISNPDLVRDLLAAGERAGVKTQREVLPFGGTDASAIQLSRGGVIAGTVSIPCRYVHSACEVIDLRDVEAARALLLEYLK